MSFTESSAVTRAKQDLAKRLNLSVTEIAEKSVSEKDFPDMALGASTAGEMAAQMISSGWSIVLETHGHRYEYRADKYQLRLHNYHGRNYVIE
ncbi:MAG: hypothetical protein K1X36_14350 [Pyrinomonadaceae bacterium]|nr:hypothetical protein [Pyrinomonadaceae bacterium]